MTDTNLARALHSHDQMLMAGPDEEEYVPDPQEKVVMVAVWFNAELDMENEEHELDVLRDLATKSLNDKASPLQRKWPGGNVQAVETELVEVTDA